MSDKMLQSLGRLRTVDSEAGTVEAVISTGNLARDDAIIETGGWQLMNFRKNPVALWSHQSFDPPIGRVLQVAKGKDDLTATIQLDMEDERALEILSKIARRFIHATSVRWLPIETEFRDSEDGEGRILVFKKQELLEVSFVSVPADPAALIKRGFSVDEIARVLEGDPARTLLGCAIGDTDCNEERVIPTPVDLGQWRDGDYRLGSIDDPQGPERGILNMETGEWTPLQGEGSLVYRVEPGIERTSLHPDTFKDQDKDNGEGDGDGDGEGDGAEGITADHQESHAQIAEALAALTEAVNARQEITIDSTLTPENIETIRDALGIEPRPAEFEPHWERMPSPDAATDPERLMALGMIASPRQADAWNQALEVYLADGTDPDFYMLADDLDDGERLAAVELAWQVYGATVPEQQRQAANDSLHEFMSARAAGDGDAGTREPGTEADEVITRADEVAERAVSVLDRFEAVLAPNGDGPPRLTEAERDEVHDLAVTTAELLGGIPVDETEVQLAEMSARTRATLARFVAIMSERKKNGETGDYDAVLIATLAHATGHTDGEVAALLDLKK